MEHGPPAGTAGRVETAPVQALDVAATLLDAGAATALDGAPSRSLVPFVTGDGGATRDHVASMIRMRPDLPTWQAITDGQDILARRSPLPPGCQGLGDDIVRLRDDGIVTADAADEALASIA